MPEIAWNQIKTTVQIEVGTQVREEHSWGRFWTEWVELTTKALVTAGIPEFTDADVVMDGNEVKIIVPHAKILGLKLTEIEFTDQKDYRLHSNVAALKNRAIEQARGKIIEDALRDKKILDVVELKVRQQLENQFKLLGFETILVTFNDRKPPIKVTVGEQVISIEEYASTDEVVSRSEIHLNNCGGSAPAKVSKQISEEIEEGVYDGYIYSGEFKFSGVFKFSVIFPEVETGLEHFYGVMNGRKQSVSSTVNLEAAAGTNIVYEVVWRKTKSYGEVEFWKDNQFVRKYYVVEHNLTGGIEGSRDIGCK
jgi:hypothetical protein